MGLSHSPSIVTDGLDFYIDPNNTRCYPGFGNTVYNIVNSSIGGTLVGYTSNPMDSASTRSFNFDGVNDFIDIVNSSNWNVSSLTICIWFKKNQGSVFKGIVDKGRDNYGAWSLCIDETANRVTLKVRIAGVNRSVTTTSNYNFNGWTFIAGVFDGANLSIYQNENLSSTATYIGSIGTNSHNIRIGADNDGNCVAGLISSVFIYSRGLSTAEIQQNYHATKKKYLIEENIVTDGLVLNLDPGNPNSYSGSGNTVFDLSGFGKTGTLSGGLTFSTLNGGSIVNDAGNKALFYPSANFSTNNFTMEVWVSVKSYPGTNAVFISNRGTNDNGWLLDVTLNKKGRIFIQRDAGTSYSIETINDLGLNKWAYLSVVRNGTNLSLYRDGVFQNSTTLPSNYDIQSAYVNDYALRYFTANGPLNGNVSTIKYYNRALSAQEIQQNYNATKGRFLNALPPVRNGLVLELDAANTSSYSGFGNTWYDLTGNGYNYTLTNGPVFSSFGTTQNFFFDGSNDRALAVNPISLGTTHTVSMIIKPSSSSEDGILFGDYGHDNTGYAMYVNGGSSIFYSTTNYTNIPITLSTNWIMLTITRIGTSIFLYQNGSLIGSNSLGGNNPLTLSSIADYNGGGFPFGGSISQVSCYNRALSAYEIKQNFDFYRTRYGI